jgi:hypothetical protein
LEHAWKDAGYGIPTAAEFVPILGATNKLPDPFHIHRPNQSCMFSLHGYIEAGRACFGTVNGCNSAYCPHFIVLAILTVVAAAIKAKTARWNPEITK